MKSEGELEGGDVSVVEATKDIDEPDLDEEEHGLEINKNGLVTFGLALFLHSLIDGLSVGVFKEMESVYILAASVVIHKIPVAFTLGFTFAKSNQTLDMLSTKIIIFLFLISSPLGVIFGAVISENAYDYTLLII